ncbi:hypothetical protein DPSP01_011070 [Paraphaeosphaeria sporulosa]
MLTYPQVPVIEGTHVEVPLCEKGDQRMQANAGIKLFIVTAHRSIFELFTQNILYDPAIMGSVIGMEDYSLQGAVPVDPASTAYTLRDDVLLVAAIIQYKPDSRLDDFAINWASQTCDLWKKGQPTRASTEQKDRACNTSEDYYITKKACD